ncbi:hypothetical protein BBO_04975 [Beauveria brongniartii RCEF 3172]|uniref:SnoaL-like domain-containing protein n=1 Tax=Beauveria brongniartii RCEF 3172 TaxID=1081107 RepID=A0A167DFA2_9HYPO|nr:hypothetical protein BBO_04975 [Beauveria brongniartii RCEF 3172]
MSDLYRSRADALMASYNSSGFDYMDYFASDAIMSDFHFLVFNAIDMDKEATRSFFSTFLTENSDVNFITRAVTGSNEFLAHEMHIDFVAGSDIESLSISKGQFVRLTGVSVQQWRKENSANQNIDELTRWKIFEQKDYFFVAEKRNVA